VRASWTNSHHWGIILRTSGMIEPGHNVVGQLRTVQGQLERNRAAHAVARHPAEAMPSAWSKGCRIGGHALTAERSNDVEVRPGSRSSTATTSMVSASMGSRAKQLSTAPNAMRSWPSATVVPLAFGSCF
jgi:hypothetical protein